MMVSPKAAKEAGDKFGQKPVCAGPYKFVERVQQDRIVVEKFPDYWNKDGRPHRPHHLSCRSPTPTVRLANLKSGQLDLIERSLATDIKEMRADQRLQARDDHRARLPGHHHQRRQGRGGQGPARLRPAGAPGARAGDRPRRPQPGRLQRRVRGREPVGQPREPLVPGEIPGAEARRRQGQAAARRRPASRRRSPSTSWCRTTRRRGRSPR